MTLRILLAWCAVLCLSAPALGQTRDFPAVTDASHALPDGERVISLSTDIARPPAAVWSALTTAEGWKTRLGVAQATVDLRIGGVIETSYDAATPLGSDGTIRNEIVAYVPDRMLAIRNIQAPPGFLHPEEFSRTVTVIELAPIPEGTRVTLSGVGFVPGPAYDALYTMFLTGDAYTLQLLHDSFAAAP